MGRKFTVFALFYFMSKGHFQVQAPPRGAYIRRDDLTEVFLRYDFGGLYLEGLIFGILRRLKLQNLCCIVKKLVF